MFPKLQSFDSHPKFPMFGFQTLFFNRRKLKDLCTAADDERSPWIFSIMRLYPDRYPGWWLNDPRWCRGIVWHTRQQVGLKTCYMFIIYYMVLYIYHTFHSMDWSLRAVLLFSRGGYKIQKNDIHNGITLVKRCRCIHLWRRFGGLQL